MYIKVNKHFELQFIIMEGFSGSKKRKTSSGSSKIVPSSSDTGKSTGHVKLVCLPHLVSISIGTIASANKNQIHHLLILLILCVD